MNEHLEQIKEIRTMMERSSKFLSLSGLSGISAGICALVGAWYAKSKFHFDSNLVGGIYIHKENVRILATAALIVLVSALVLGILFTVRKTKKQGLNAWNLSSKRLLVSMAIPLVAGGLFCLGMVYHSLYWVCFPATLVFYGLALVNASKYTVNDTFSLGICEIILGIVSLFFTVWNLYFWAIGFGILHIVYGSVMYFKYDRQMS